MTQNAGKYPVKIGPGDIRYVDAKFGPAGQVKILPPKRPPLISPKPVVNTTVPSPAIMNSVAQIARTLVLKGAKAGDPEPYVFGRASVRPLVIAADDSGEYLVLDLLWSVGPVQRVCNGIVPSTSSPGSWDYKLWPPDLGSFSVTPGALHEHFLGAAGQSASTIMTALKGSYPAYPGLAHSVISLQPGWNLNLLGYVDGVEVLDPRISPQSAWTENPALILADILTRCGYTMNWTSVGEAADYCDEGVDSFESPLSARWKIGGVIQTRQELQSTVFSLAQYTSCYVDVRGGEVILAPDKPRASNHTVTADDMLGDSVRLKRRSARDKPSLVTVNYLASSSRSTWTASFGTSGGSGTESTINMPYWDTRYPAGRKAEEIYNKLQHDIESLEFTRFDDGLIRTLGDVGTITNAAVGLTAETMALVENEPVSRGRWRCKYVPYSAADYVDSFAADYGGAEGTVNNPFSPPAGPTPTLTAELVTSTSPNYYRIKIEFSPVTWAYLRDYKVNVYIDGVSPQTILHSEYVPRGSETGSPQTITVYADLSDSPGFQMAIGTSPQTVYRVDVYNRSLWLDQEGNEILSANPGTATVTDPPYQTTAKWFGNGDSPSNYYRTGGGSVIGESPQNWDALLPEPSQSGGSYNRITLVFCVHPNEYGFKHIFACASAQFAVAINDDDGGLWITARSKDDNSIQSVTISASGSPTDAGGLTKDAWHAVMITALYYTSPSDGIYLEVMIDGVEVYAGDWNTTFTQFNPMAQSGYCYVGKGELYNGTPNDALNCYLSFVWCDEEYLGTGYWSDFFDENNKPKDIGADGSIPTGSAPVSFFPDADFTNNRGTGPDWTEVGTVPDAPTSPTD